ncbi:MAG: tetratricopeptide repeat protein [Bacteroidota bacterium]
MTQEQAGGEEQASQHLEVGSLLLESGFLLDAMEQFDQAAPLLLPNHPKQIVVNYSIGLIYLELTEFDHAKEHFEVALHLARQKGAKKEIALIKGFLGNYYEETGQYERALSLQRESLRAFSSESDSLELAVVYCNIGRIYADVGKEKLAYDYFTQADKFSTTLLHAKRANILNNLGDVFRRRAQYTQAFSYTRQALRMAAQLNDPDQLILAHRDLAETFELTGQFDSAYFHLESAGNYESSLSEQQAQLRVEILQTFHEIHQQEKLDGELQAAAERASRKQQFMYLGGGVLIALLLVGYRYQNKRKDDANGPVSKPKPAANLN